MRTRRVSLDGNHTPEIKKAKLANHPYVLGRNYFIRTITHHYTGCITAVYDREIVLSDAAWIPDDGRLTQALETETFNEVEMYPKRPVIIGREAILDAVQITTLPAVQK